MPDLLRQASDWLEGRRKAYAAGAVTYCRGEQTVVVQATVGSTMFEVESDYGAIERTESRDFLITAADLVLDGAEVLPVRGDQVKELVGSATVVYEVMAPGDEPPWRYSDPWRETLRIHTKYVDVE